MWAFLSARIRRWLLLAVAAPLGAAAAQAVAQRIEGRHGHTRASGGARRVEPLLNRRPRHCGSVRAT
jgi:hypothetical protein